MSSKSLLGITAGCALTALVLACGDSTSPPGAPAALLIVVGDSQTGTVGQELPEALVVRVVDDRNHPVRDQIVNFRVVSGDGSVFAGVALTDRSGEARERWTLGTVAADSQVLEARAVDTETGEPLVFGRFHAIAIADAPASIAKVTGGGADPNLVVLVQDPYGNPVAGVDVGWAVTSGVGALSDSLTETDVAGLTATSVMSATGTVAVEASATGLTGSPVAFSFEGPPPGFALDFNQSFVVVPDDPDLDLATTWTIEAWIKPRTASGAGDEHVISKWGGCADASYSVVIRASKIVSGIASCANGTQEFESVGTIADGQWVHVALTLSNDSLRWYINGVLDTVRTGSQAPLNTGTDLTLGRHSGGGLDFDGVLDEVRIWTVARTAAQIAGAMNSRLQGNEGGLVAYWRFDEGSGDSAFDATGRGHTGRLGDAVGPDANDPQWTTGRAPIP